MLSVLAFTAALGFSGAAGATLINRGADLRRRPQHPLARECEPRGYRNFWSDPEFERKSDLGRKRHHALAENAALVINNLREFERVPN